MKRHLWIGCLILLLPLAMLAQGQDVTLPITQDVSYTVRPSDTLDTIGSLFDVSPSCLAEINELARPGDLRIGQVLTISISCARYGEDPRDRTVGLVAIPRVVSSYEDSCEGYRIRSNDTLDVLAQINDISLEALLMANDINPGDLLVVNTCILFPEDAPPYGQVPAMGAGMGGGSTVPGEAYVVQRGDTLDVIAQLNNVSLVSLQLANGINRGRDLRPGMTIVIPDDAPAYGLFPAVDQPMIGQIYIVGTGESLDAIARRFDVSLASLEFTNGVTPGRNVLPGTPIMIPANAPAYGVEEFDAMALSGQGIGAQTAGPVYVVQYGDTLDVISASYNLDTQCLADANNLERPGLIFPGQTLLIDESCGPYTGDIIIPTLSQAISTGSQAQSADDAEEDDEEAQPLGG